MLVSIFDGMVIILLLSIKFQRWTLQLGRHPPTPKPFTDQPHLLHVDFADVSVYDGYKCAFKMINIFFYNAYSSDQQFRYNSLRSGVRIC